MPSPSEYAEQARFDNRTAEREELKALRAENAHLVAANIQLKEAYEQLLTENIRMMELAQAHDKGLEQLEKSVAQLHKQVFGQ